MNIKLRIQYLEKIPHKTFRGQSALTDILSNLNEQSLLEKINYIALNDSSRRKKIKSAKSLVEESRDWKDIVFELSVDKTAADDYLIKARLENPILWLLMSFGKDKLQELCKTILEQWKELLVELNKKYSDSLFFGPTLAVEVYDLQYTALRPERNHPLVRNNEVVSVFSKKFQKQHRLGNIKELNRLFKTELPATATIEEKGDLVFFRTNGRGVISHVGMVIENDGEEIKFIHSSTSKGVIISSTKEPYYKRTFAQANRVIM